MIAPAIAFALVLGAFIFFVLPRKRPRQRAASVGLYIVLLAMVYAGSTELMGRSKPLRLEWRNASEAKVIAATMKENEAIYVWLDIEGQSEPRSYALPWSQEMAQQLQRAMSDAQQNGTEVKMASPFEGEGLDDREPKFYAMPQPPMPDKDYGDSTDGPIIVPQPASGG
jgi:hypothetical protein